MNKYMVLLWIYAIWTMCWMFCSVFLVSFKIEFLGAIAAIIAFISLFCGLGIIPYLSDKLNENLVVKSKGDMK